MMSSSRDAEPFCARLASRFDAAAYGESPMAALSSSARHHPGQPALMDARQQLSYLDLRAAVLELAVELQRRGVRPGDRVMIAAENTPACVALLYAVQLLEAWPAILNPRVARAEIAALRACCRPRCTVFAVDDAPAALDMSAQTGGERFISTYVGTLVFGSVADVSPETVAGSTGSRVALLIFTSGTSGLPKAVMLSESGLAKLGRVLAQSRMTHAGDIVQGIAPLSHIMGISNLMSAMQAGATLRLMPRLELPSLASGIAGGAITHLSFVPTVYTKLIEYIDRNAVSMTGNKLRYISCGGAPLDPSLKRRVEKTFGLRLVNGYGMTECAPGLRTRPDCDVAAECIGWPEHGVEVRLEGADTADGTGELWLRSATMMAGYYGDSIQTAAALRSDGWLATGDLARASADGSFAIVGRRKEMIIRSGFNVYPAEVEAALNQIPQVLQSGVVGRKAQEGNEDIVAFVQLRHGARLEQAEILGALRELIAPYKIPSRVEFLQALPLGQTGKIWKARLQQMAAELADSP